MLQQNKMSKFGRTTPLTAYCAGMAAAQVYSHTVDAAFTAANDVLELGALPAGAQLISATLITGPVEAGVTANLVIIDGDYGDDDTGRAAETTIQAGIAAHNSEVALDVSNLIAIAPDETRHRGIGLEFSADLTAGATKTIQLVLQYHF